MDELIRGQALIDAQDIHNVALELLRYDFEKPSQGKIFIDFLDYVVTNCKVVDAVHVVRCGECRHYMTDPGSFFKCDNDNGMCRPKPYDYCSEGERRVKIEQG